MQWLMVFLGGGLGSCCRYLLSILLPKEKMLLPYGTILANFLACIVLGALTLHFVQKHSDNHTVFWLVGFCGGFSTFSTFSLETLHFLEKGLWQEAILNILLSITICLLGLIIGAKLIIDNG